MYFDKSKIVCIKGLLNPKYEVFAHKKMGDVGLINEPLEDHISLSVKYFMKIVNEKGIYESFERIEREFLKNISSEGISLFREMIVSTIVLHDMGKINPLFQHKKLGNNLKIRECDKLNNTNHSMLSAVIYIDIYFNKIMELMNRSSICKLDIRILFDFMMMNAYTISRHHGRLNSMKEFEEKFKTDGEGYKLFKSQKALHEITLKKNISITLSAVYKVFKSNEDLHKGQSKEQNIYKYIYERLMLSIVVACDFYSTSEFMDDFEISDIGNINDVSEFYDEYKNGEIYNLIRKYEKDEYGKNNDFLDVKDINILRNELFLDAEKKLQKNKEADLFYLEAPTGSGKSNTAMNLSFRLLERDSRKNKVFYVYPFNTLVEQNINTMNEIFEKREKTLEKIAVINSIEPIKTEKKIYQSEDTEQEFFKKALMNRQFLNYPVVLTTHVTMFKYLFGTSKEDIFPLHQMSNSIIVLDEVQSYKNIIWGEIITFLTCYAKILNIKVIIMSATLPNLDLLALTEGNTVQLIDDRKKYFENPIFKDRVEVDFSLMDAEDIKDELYEHVKNLKKEFDKVLVEFISKKSAYEFYNRLKEDYEIISQVELITGDDNIAERGRVIKLVKDSEDIILVATQVIEAGVDIDMDIGYKDISMLDCEEQFLGRINRSCKKSDSKVYFFNMDKASGIYKNDVRMQRDMTLENEHIRELLGIKNFQIYYNDVIERLKNETEEVNDRNIHYFFDNEVKQLEFNKVSERMKLINDDDNKISVYLNNPSLEVNGEILDGEELWDNYRRILEDYYMDYAKKQIELSEVRAKMNNFIYEIKWNDNFTYNDRLGELYFIFDGEKYFREGKLDKDKFISGIGDFI